MSIRNLHEFTPHLGKIIVNSFTKSCSVHERPRQNSPLIWIPIQRLDFLWPCWREREGTGGIRRSCLFVLGLSKASNCLVNWLFHTKCEKYQRMTVDKTEVLHINKLHWLHIEPPPEDVILRFLPCFARPRSNFRWINWIMVGSFSVPCLMTDDNNPMPLVVLTSVK